MIKIAHTSDIHIRSLSRHDEYRHVLKSFADDCASQKVDHIFVGGDIFHTKTSGISPEYIEFLTWWLNYMSNVAPVHLVLGNHDLNLSNLSRQDAVTPIVEAMRNPRVFLYKKSGVYNFAPGYNWCVFSCADEPGWSSVRPVSGCVNIATFHGGVRGSLSETGWEIEEDKITIDFFRDYDFCMLGDIHRQQFLGYRNGNPWIAYPGTLVQQNYAEQIDHGYLLWTITSSNDWKVENRHLPNPIPFVTIDWLGSLEKTIDYAKNFPKGSRFRIRSQTQLTQKDVHLISETLKTSMSASEVTYKSDHQIDKNLVKTNTSVLSKTDLRSPDVLTKLVKDFYKDDEVADVEFRSITDQLQSYLSSIKSTDEVPRGSKWSLRRLEWDNLFAYGENNVVDFEKLNGIVGIFGPNRTGKSSIVGTLMYSLFNTTDRGPMKNINICNVRKTYCSSRVVFDHNSTSTYVLERQTTKNTNKKGVVSASTSLNLFRLKDDGELEDLCGEQRSDTEKTLRTLLGNSEDFLMTSLSAQGETNQFLSQGSTKRRALLTRFLDLDVFDKICELASKETSSVKSQLKNFPDRDWEELFVRNESLVVSHEDNIRRLTDSISEYQAAMTILHQQLSKHNVSPVSMSDVDQQRIKIDSLIKKLNDYETSLASLREEMTSLKVKSDEVQRIADSFDVDSLKKKLDVQRKLASVITEIRHLHEKETTLLTQQKKSLKILDEVPCGDHYPDCKFIKDAHYTKKSMKSQEEKVASLKQRLEDVTTSISEIQDSTIEEKLARSEKADRLLSKIQLEVSRKETEIEKITSQLSSCQSTLCESKSMLLNLEEAVKKSENIEVVSIRSKISELSESIRRLDSEKMDAASSRGRILSDLENLRKEKKSRDELLRSVIVHELIANAFSKRGIPLLVTKSQLPLINAEVAKILQGIVDFTIEIERDEETDSLEIYIDYGDSRRIIELCSGMEKTIAAISLRVAMVNVSSLPKPDFFIIDEGFGTLDSSGVEACSRLLTSLKRYFKTVIVITHVDGIKDASDHIIEITKSEKDSRVEYT